MLIAALSRRLNDGVDYATFRKAWLPDEIVPGDPRTKVFSALNVEDPRELFTVALIENADPADIPAWMARLTPIEERRYERIRHLVSEPTLNAVYQVIAEDDLSQPITE
ncbi:hypothetical protein DFR70_1193 [Nocardia tenerifensis]|uniref:Uncharacterized protein n=1 Tax=Nocardia tenerifensis TaxID=228006 RepID=A0A318JP21_9NOCA|nr:hypothetical protein [Nocardia tenerifensis]PXX56451.1 hypothetical protein DFR70_1193 [Nocardia tenerifensis]